MPRPKQVSDQQIRSAARRVFQEVGVKAPVSLIAKALGVTPAALFHRTGPKAQMFVMAMRPVPPREFKLLAVMRSGPAPGMSPDQQLVEILTRLSAHLAVTSPNAFLLFAAGIRGSMRKWRLPGLTRRHLSGWLARARPLAGWTFHNASAIAEALVGALEARHMYGFLSGRRTSVAAERRFVRALVEELLGVPRAAASAEPSRPAQARTLRRPRRQDVRSASRRRLPPPAPPAFSLTPVMAPVNTIDGADS